MIFIYSKTESFDNPQDIFITIDNQALKSFEPLFFISARDCKSAYEQYYGYMMNSEFYTKNNITFMSNGKKYYDSNTNEEYMVTINQGNDQYKVVGVLQIYPYKADNQYGIGYSILPGMVGNGYGKIIMRHGLKMIAEKSKIMKKPIDVYLTVMEDNSPSINIIEKNGFKLEFEKSVSSSYMRVYKKTISSSL